MEKQVFTLYLGKILLNPTKVKKKTFLSSISNNTLYVGS